MFLPFVWALSLLFASQMASSTVGSTTSISLTSNQPSSPSAAQQMPIILPIINSTAVSANSQEEQILLLTNRIGPVDIEGTLEGTEEDEEKEEEGRRSQMDDEGGGGGGDEEQQQPDGIASSITTSTIGIAIPAEHPFVLFARNIYSWLVPSMVAILLLAVLGNSLIVVSAPWLSGEASHYNWLCVSLAGADAWAASLLISGLIMNSYVPVVLKIAWDGSKCVAAFLEIFRIAGMLTSNLHILALAANQFFGICHPLLYKATISTDHVRWLILLLWVIPIGFVGAWFVSVPGDSLLSDSCRHEFYTRLPFRLYIFVAFASILLLTVLIYAHILVYLLRQKARYRSRRNSLFYSYHRRVQSKMKLLTTTLLILSTFTLSWGVCVLYFVLVCKQGCPFIYLQSISFQTGLLLNSSVNFLVALKLVLNPLIYALRMVHIRKSVADLLGAAIAIRSRSFSSSQLLTLRPISRQLSSPRPFTRSSNIIIDDRAQSPLALPISDPPSRAEPTTMEGGGDCGGGGGGGGSSRELIKNRKWPRNWQRPKVQRHGQKEVRTGRIVVDDVPSGRGRRRRGWHPFGRITNSSIGTTNGNIPLM